jgi:hypothetical protein
MKSIYKLKDMRFSTMKLATEAAELIGMNPNQIQSIPVCETLDESKYIQQHMARIRNEKKAAMEKIKKFNASQKPKTKKKGKKK